MNSDLPTVNIPIKGLPDDIEQTEFLKYSDDYQKLLKIITDHVGADCWAMTVDNQVLFNAFKTENSDTISFKNVIQEDLIRDKIIENPHSIFVHINRRNVDAKVVVYMFQDETWTLTVDYVAKQQKYVISFHSSKPGFKW